MTSFSFRAVRVLKFVFVALLPLVALSACVTGVGFGFDVFDAADSLRWFQLRGADITFLPLNAFFSTFMFLLSAVLIVGSFAGSIYSAVRILPWAWTNELPHTAAEIAKGSYIMRYAR